MEKLERLQLIGRPLKLNAVCSINSISANKKFTIRAQFLLGDIPERQRIDPSDNNNSKDKECALRTTIIASVWAVPWTEEKKQASKTGLYASLHYCPRKAEIVSMGLRLTNNRVSHGNFSVTFVTTKEFRGRGTALIWNYHGCSPGVGTFIRSLVMAFYDSFSMALSWFSREPESD